MNTKKTGRSTQESTSQEPRETVGLKKTAAGKPSFKSTKTQSRSSEDPRATPVVNNEATLSEPCGEPLEQARAQDVPGKDALLSGAAEPAISLQGVLTDVSEITSPSEVNERHQSGGELNSLDLDEQETRPAAHGHGGRAGQGLTAEEDIDVDGISSPHCASMTTKGGAPTQKEKAFEEAQQIDYTPLTEEEEDGGGGEAGGEKRDGGVSRVAHGTQIFAQ